MRTETLAVVFTDLKGYTETTSQQTHQENAQLLKQVERMVAPVVKVFNGRVVKSIGDAYMLVFRSPTEAVQCAMAVQDRLHEHNNQSGGAEGDGPIELRIALNIGEVRVHRGDVFGEPVNIAARVEGITAAGEIYLTEAVYLTMNRSDTAIERVGDYELKGIPEPITVYRAVPFAHTDDDQALRGDNDDVQASDRRKMPFGGLQLSRYVRLNWLRRVYQGMWSLAILGVLGAAYLRYQPSSDFTHLVEQTRLAAEQGDPLAVFAAAGQIPPDALEERAQVRRYRRTAVTQLIADNKIEIAKLQVERLVAEDPRDAEALMLQGLLHARDGKIPAALSELEKALRLNPEFKHRPEVVSAVVSGYTLATTRTAADTLVREVLQDTSIDAMAKLVNNGGLSDRRARIAVADRLRQLGADEKVDKVQLWVADLESSSCKLRKAAIAKLRALDDVGAVGPLQKFAQTKTCQAAYAGRVADQLVK